MLHDKFIAAFQRGIEGELEAMKASAEAFEVPLARGEELGALRYTFELGASERLVPGTVCALRSARGEQRVTIERSAEERVTLVATQPIDVGAECALVVAPSAIHVSTRRMTTRPALTERQLGSLSSILLNSVVRR